MPPMSHSRPSARRWPHPRRASGRSDPDVHVKTASSDFWSTCSCERERASESESERKSEDIEGALGSDNRNARRREFRTRKVEVEGARCRVYPGVLPAADDVEPPVKHARRGRARRVRQRRHGARADRNAGFGEAHAASIRVAAGDNETAADDAGAGTTAGPAQRRALAPNVRPRVPCLDRRQIVSVTPPAQGPHLRLTVVLEVRQDRRAGQLARAAQRRDRPPHTTRREWQ